MKRAWRISFVSIIVCVTGCAMLAPRIPDYSVSFVQETTGTVIPRILVLPHYSSSVGVGTLSGPSKSSWQDFVAKPFVYSAGDSFQVRQGKALFIGIPPLAGAGRSTTLEGVVVVAKGCKPKLIGVGRLIRREKGMRVEFSPVSNNTYQVIATRLHALLTGKTTKLNKDEQIWGTDGQFTYKVYFNEEESHLVQEFLSDTDSVKDR